jgi:tetratricopeptide (TPR) repeat protein
VPAPRFRWPAGVVRPFRSLDQEMSRHFRDPKGLLVQLRAQLVASGSAAVLARAALYGMGGVGKTQLALKYSEEYRDAYAGVWWFRAESSTTLQLDARDCCQAVGAPIAEGEDATQSLKRWLEALLPSPRGGGAGGEGKPLDPATSIPPWLLVYDNAEDPEALRPHLPRGRHHLIITSRNPAWRGLAEPVELEVWTPEQGADFLAARLPVADRDEMLALAADLGGLPLALEQAASYMEQRGTPVATYRALLAAVDTEGLILDQGRAATGYERSVAATLSLAFDRLSPAAARLLRLLAFAAPEPLAERFFHEAAAELPEELAVAATQPLVWEDLMEELLGYGLAQRTQIPALDRPPGQDDGRTEPALVLHRLTQQVVRARLAQPHDDVRGLQAVLQACCPEGTELPDNWPRYAALAEHVTQLDRFEALGWLDTRRHTWLLDRVASYLREGPALYAEAVQWFQRALELNCRDFGEEDENSLSGMNNLAITLSQQGDMAGAREMQEQVLKIRHRVYGEEDLANLCCMNNLAEILRQQGELDEARKMHRQVLDLCIRALGEEHPETLTSMNNLALTFLHPDDLTTARMLQERVLEVGSRAQGKDNPNTLRAMNNLASTLMQLGDLEGARKLEEEALEIRHRRQGDEHPDTLIGMSNLAFTYWQLGERAEACTLIQAAALGLDYVLGPQHPNSLLVREFADLMLRTPNNTPTH